MIVLVSVCNREIDIDKFGNEKDAIKEMKRRYDEVIADEDSVDDSYFDEYRWNAWANIDDGDYQYNWVVAEV